MSSLVQQPRRNEKEEDKGFSDVNKVRKSNGHKTEVSPRVSPCAFKNGPEVPRTIYPGLDDVPDCDGRLLL